MKTVLKAEHDAFTKRVKEAEFYETPVWAAERILDVELCTPLIVDPCAGRGVLGRAARGAGYETKEFDLNAWPNESDDHRIQSPVDFMSSAGLQQIDHQTKGREFTVFMNPPFSMTVDFIEKCFELGARKVVMFQRLAFLESAIRRSFFEDTAPARVWLCGDRAVSWRGDIPLEDMQDETGEIIKGQKGRSTPTPHAWFVWEESHRGLMSIHHLYKDA